MNKKEDQEKIQRTFKEKRIREICLAYYSQREIKKAIFDFSKNREIVPRYFEGFGKRPDILQFENDILEQVKKGATSFHSSQELWKDPLELSLEFSRNDFNELRLGWDLLIDIDSPYLEYSKIYATLLINSLKSQGIANIGVKFSGSKGFHILVPFEAFPKEVCKEKTKDMFPEWPRIICEYLSAILQPKLEQEILKTDDLKNIARKTGKLQEELIVNECNLCKRPAIKKELVSFRCPACKNLLTTIRKTKRIPKCPNEECRKNLIEETVSIIFVCESCNVNSNKNPEYFGIKKSGFIEDKIIPKTRYKTEEHIEADLVLVSSRHLFRMPYSLHEKTSLCSVVIDRDSVQNFQIKDAKPFLAKIKSFYPKVRFEEAKNLLREALDWKEQKENEERLLKEKIEKTFYNKESFGFLKPLNQDKKDIIIPNPPKEIFPPGIELLLNGVKEDGRKRALFILISFFNSLGIEFSDLEKRIYEWNEKNRVPLKKGYIQSQLNWIKKVKKRLPPNFNNPIYRELGVDKQDELTKITKNPVSYAIKKYFMMKK